MQTRPSRAAKVNVSYEESSEDELNVVIMPLKPESNEQYVEVENLPTIPQKRGRPQISTKKKDKRSETPSIAIIYNVPEAICNDSVVVDDGSGIWDYSQMANFNKPLDYFLYFCSGEGINRLVTATNRTIYGLRNEFSILDLYKYIGAMFIMDCYPVIRAAHI